MRNPMITIVFEPTEEQAAEWQGRFAVIAPMNHEEWLDLWKFLASIDGFVERITQVFVAVKQALEAGQPVTDDALRQFLVLAEDAQGAASIMPAVHYLMNRFAMVTEAQIKKERLQ